MARILLIDDDDLVRESLSIVLEEDGHEVTQANDGKIGLIHFQSATFDLVVTDLIMPEQEGISVVMAIRKSHPQQKVIAISGGGRQSAESYLNMAKNLGARETLEKPFSGSELKLAVDRVLAS